MTGCNQPPRAFTRLSVGLMVIAVLMTGSLFGKGIRVDVVPSNAQPTPGQQLSVAINLDLTSVAEALGSYTATVRWNPQALKYLRHSGGTSPGFSSPLVNTEKVGDGMLSFAAANPHGGKDVVNILNLKFEVTGAASFHSGLEVEFSAMAAAFSFNDLLPQLEPMVTGVEDLIKIADVPATYALLQNQPNPFSVAGSTSARGVGNPGTEIQYELPRQSRVILSVFNLLGQKVRTLVSGTREPGTHAVRWDGTDDNGNLVPSGIYIYRMETAGFVQKRKMTLLQ